MRLCCGRPALGGKLSKDYHRGLSFSGGRRIFGKKVEDSTPEAFAGILPADRIPGMLDEIYALETLAADIGERGGGAGIGAKLCVYGLVGAYDDPG